MGTVYHQTPILAADMKYVVLNPIWTVTRSIIRNEMLPRMKADVTYLPSRNFDLIGRAGKKVVTCPDEDRDALLGHSAVGLTQHYAAPDLCRMVRNPRGQQPLAADEVACRLQGSPLDCLEHF